MVASGDRIVSSVARVFDSQPEGTGFNPQCPQANR